MGVDFRAGRPGRSIEDLLSKIEENLRADCHELTDELRERLDEELGYLGGASWEGVDGAPRGPGMGYGYFSKFRELVAREDGIELLKMWGYAPSDDIGAWRRMNPDARFGDMTEKDYEGALDNWYKNVIIQWDDLATPTTLRPLLDHSDCEGEMTPEECAQVAPRLAEIVRTLQEHDEARERGAEEQLVVLMTYCGENDCHLLFR